MTSLLLLVGLAATPFEQAEFNLKVPGATLRTISAEIGQQMGWEIQLDPAVANEVLVIRSGNRSAKEIIDRIAEVTATKWTLSGDRMIILPDQALRAKRLEAQQGEYAEAVRVSRNYYMKAMRDPKFLEEYFGVPQISVEEKVLLDTVTGLGEAPLLRVTPGQRIVYSSNPNRLQTQIGRFDSKLVQSWSDETAQTYSDAMAQQAAAFGIPEFQPIFQMLGIKDDPSKGQAIEPAAKFQIVVSRPDQGGYLSELVTVEVQVVSATGKILAFNSTDFGIGSDWDPALYEESEMPESDEPEMDDVPLVEPQAGDDLPIQLSPEYVAIRNATLYNEDDEFTRDYKPEVWEKLRNVVEYEPLRFELGEPLLAAAEALDRTIVTLLPDITNEYMEEIPKTVKEVREWADYYEIEEGKRTTDGWWEFRPLYPGKAHSDRVDRAALGELLRSGEAQGRLPLDPVSTFLYREGGWSNHVTYQRLELFAPHTLFGETDETAMRLYGAMSAGERLKVRRGESISLGSISAPVRQVLMNLFLGAGGFLQAVDEKRDLAERTPLEELEDRMRESVTLGNFYYQPLEPTEFLANGLPSRGMILGRATEESYVAAVNDKGIVDPSLGNMGRSELMWLEVERQFPGMAYTDESNKASLNRLARGSMTTIRLAVLIQPDLGFAGVIEDVVDPDTTQTFTIANLPADLKKQVENDLKSMQDSPIWTYVRQSLEMRRPGGPGGRVIRP